MQLSDLYRNYRRYSGDQESFQTYTTREMVLEELEKTKAYWQEKVNVAYHTGDSDFQPVYALGKFSANPDAVFMAAHSFRIMITEREEGAGVISGRIVWHF